jgi:serine protease Do
MKSLKITIMVLVALVVVGVFAFTPVVPRSLAALTELQLANSEQAAAAPIQPANALRTGSADLQTTLEQVYEKSKDSVVNIHVTMNASQALGMQGLPNFGGQLPQIPGLPDFGQLMPNLPDNNNQGSDQGTPQDPNSVPVAQALGSGFVWDADGHIVTNNHVVDGATKITVTFADGTEVPATLVGHDPDSDLAVIKVDTKGLDLKPVNTADSTAVKPGQFTVAIGNPFGLEGTLTFGIVSAVGRSMPAKQDNVLATNAPSYTIPDIIQTDTPINPGNSGGVLLDLDGNLIGVPTAIESQSGQSAGIGFAVPSSIVNNIVPELIKSGKVVHPWLGLSGTTLTSALAAAMNLPETQRGALVADVTSGGPAAKAGLQGSTQDATIDGRTVKVGGDVITAINNQPVKRFDDLVAFLAREGKVGSSVSLTVLHDRKEMTLNVTLGSRPAANNAGATQNQGQQNQGQQQQPNRRGQNNGQPNNNGQQDNNQQNNGQQGNGPQNNGQPNNGQQPGQQAPATRTPWLGISGVTMTSEIAQAMSLADNTQGVLVASVMPNSPARKAGLAAGTESFTTSDGQDIKIGGDIITAMDGQDATSIQQLSQAIAKSKAGQKVILSILRDGESQDITVTLAARPVTQIQ